MLLRRGVNGDFSLFFALSGAPHFASPSPAARSLGDATSCGVRPLDPPWVGARRNRCLFLFGGKAIWL